MKCSFFVLTAVLGLGSLAFGADDPTDVPDHSLSEWKLGDLITGPEVSLDKMDGKVVAIELWGIN